MDNVKAIAKVKVGANDMPTNDVKIINIEIKEYKDGKLNDYTVGDLEAVLDKIADINEKLKIEKEALKKERMEANKGRVVKAGDEVLVHYTLTLEDGTKVDSSRDRGEEFKFTVKAEPAQLNTGFEDGVLGMKMGEKKSLKLEPKDAYGEYDPKMIQEVDKVMLTSQGIEPKVGMELSN
jgi:FKBP-type peptidyl-prolyl cis-trans isomerase